LVLLKVVSAKLRIFLNLMLKKSILLERTTSELEN